MKVVMSLSAFSYEKGRKPRDPKADTETSKKLTEDFAKWFDGIKTRLEKKYGKVTGKPNKVFYDNRNNKFDNDNGEASLTFKVDGFPFRFKVMVFTKDLFKEAKLLLSVSCGDFKKKLPREVATSAQTYAAIVEAVEALLVKAEKQKNNPKPLSRQEQADADKYEARVAEVREEVKSINALMPEGQKVKLVKSQHLGMKIAYAKVVGESDKVGGMIIRLTDDGKKFSVSYRPKGFMGGDESWPDKKFQHKPLTTANLAAALKNNGFL